MTRNPYDELLATTGEDGASVPWGTVSKSHCDELDDLMQAWFQERRDNIETRMFLDQACQLLGRILAEGSVSSSTHRRAKGLILAIKASRRAEKAR